MFTKSGFGALIAATVTLLCGWWWNYAELVALGGAVIALLASALIVVRTRQPTRVERVLANPRVPRGLDLQVDYRLHNPTRRRSPPVEIIDELDDTTTTTPVPSLAQHERLTLTAFMPTTRRGIFTAGPGSIERIDPFGLTVGRRQELGEAEVIVHPRVHAIDGPFGKLHTAADDAITRSIASDPLSGFVSLREYVEGDDPRLIHWPTTARTGTLMLREHVELRRPEFTVIVDASTNAATPTDFEEMVDVAASLAVHALRTGIDVRVRTTNPEFHGTPLAIERDTEVLDFLTPVTQTSADHNLALAQLLDPGQRIGRVAFVTGPDGPSSTTGHDENVSVIRIGKGAAAADGIASATETAAEFAQGWR